MRLMTLGALLPLTGGCVAAALLPLAASSGAIVASPQIVRAEMARKRERRATAQAPAPGTTVEVDGQRLTVLSGATGLPAPDGSTPPPRPGIPAAAPLRAGAVPEGMQYLYGSGEAGAASIQAYRSLARFLADVATYGRKTARRQAVLSDGASLNAPQFEPCGPKPLAIVLDIDETAILNIGYEADAAGRGDGYDAARWARWEATGADKVVAVPGAKMAIDQARTLGIAVIFNSNRDAATATQTEAALDHAGLGPARHGTTLWLRGDDGGGSGKDDRRWAIASGYCVVALVGDQLGDFSDLFDAPGLTPSTRRALAGAPALASLWGNGWFVLPNPVYGTALRGGADDIFPHDMRWTDPGPGPGPGPGGEAPAAPAEPPK